MARSILYPNVVINTKHYVLNLRSGRYRIDNWRIIDQTITPSGDSITTEDGIDITTEAGDTLVTE